MGKHWHKINKKGKTLSMTTSYIRALLWLISSKVKGCSLPYSWFDRKKNKWCGNGYDSDGMCMRVE